MREKGDKTGKSGKAAGYNIKNALLNVPIVVLYTYRRHYEQ